MTSIDTWLPAFPIGQAGKAVSALCESWRILAAVRGPYFHHGTREPHLTRALKTHVERVTAREYGLLGMWATEAVQNEMNLHTGELIEERRTDIVYCWNNEEIGIELVFEFKKLNRRARSRIHYLGENGLGRFVTGTYSRGQPIAVMVGVLMDPKDQIVPALLAALADSNTVALLRLQLGASGQVIDQPSQLFLEADFDTEHERDANLAPSHGTIRVAHLFFEFGYTAP